MQLLSILSIIASVAAVPTDPNPEYCTRPSQDFVIPTNVDMNLTTHEASNLFSFYCSKDEKCIVPLKTSLEKRQFGGLDSNQLRERMQRNYVSTEVFWWGYQVYLPSSTVDRSANGGAATCGALATAVGACLAPAGALIGIWCAGTFSSILYHDKDGKGVILGATWGNLASPLASSGADYY